MTDCGRSVKATSNQQPAASIALRRQRTGCWLLAADCLVASREARQGAPNVESLRKESRELVLMLGKSVATATMQGVAGQ